MGVSQSGAVQKFCNAFERRHTRPRPQLRSGSRGRRARWCFAVLAFHLGGLPGGRLRRGPGRARRRRARRRGRQSAASAAERSRSALRRPRFLAAGARYRARCRVAHSGDRCADRAAERAFGGLCLFVGASASSSGAPRLRVLRSCGPSGASGSGRSPRAISRRHSGHRPASFRRRFGAAHSAHAGSRAIRCFGFVPVCLFRRLAGTWPFGSLASPGMRAPGWPVR